MSGLSSLILFAIFAVGAAATWVAGVYLSKTTDALDDRLHLGEALGGMILLAVAGSLPEAAITVSAVLQHHIDIAAGNLAGGIAMQTMVLAICDAVVSRKQPLSYLVGSLIPVLEAGLVVCVVALVLMGTLLPSSVNLAGMSPASIAIVVVWVGGVWVLNRVRKSPMWQIVMPGSKPGRPHRRVPHPQAGRPYAHVSTLRVELVFLAACLVTLAGGVALQMSGSALAGRAGINGVVFGATVLALVSALPEISSGIAAVRLGDNQLAMADVFGGNSFQVCLFVVADLLAGKPVLPASGAVNAWLAGVGILITMVYAVAVVIRPQRCVARLGIDSIVASAFFIVGLLAIYYVPH